MPALRASGRREPWNLYVGNLSSDTSESDLQAAFAAYGAVSTARIATDRDTGRARGFGFVEMSNQAESQAAIAGLNGKELQGRTLTVNEAKPREERGSGGNRGNGGGYSSGRGGGGNRWQAVPRRPSVALVRTRLEAGTRGTRPLLFWSLGSTGCYYVQGLLPKGLNVGKSGCERAWE